MRHPGLGATTRRGYGLVEVALSSLILAAALSLSLAAFSRIATERKAVDRRQRANQEVVNAMERFLRLPWPERTAARAAKIADEATPRLQTPGARLAFDVAEIPGPPAARKVVARVDWKASEAAEPPVKLVAWTYADAGARP